MSPFFVFLCFNILFTLVFPSKCSYSGVSPSECSNYEAETFTCDGKILPKELINDDYCDCPQSGKDEPGTAACNQGKFFCNNENFVGKYIWSSFVRDGICDCCDGSDELPGVCQNTCASEASEQQKDLIQSIAKYEEGLKIRNNMNGKKFIQDAKHKIELNKLEMEERNIRLEALQKEKELLEEEERIRQEEEDEQKRKDADLRAAENPQDQQPGPDATTTNVQEEQQPGEVQPDIRSENEVVAEDNEFLLDTDDDGEHVPVAEKENFPYPEEYRPKKDDLEKKEENFPYPEEYRPKTDDVQELEETDNKERELVAEDDDFDIDIQEEEEEEEEEKIIDPQAELNNKRIREKTNEIGDVERKVRELKKDNDKLEKFVGMDFGEADAFAALSDQCFSTKVDKYDYEVCLYTKASQKENSRSTSLGDFDSLMHFYDHSELKFTNGQSCWKGPKRSLKVTIVCGNTNQLVNVAEPSTCAYTATFETPTACTHAGLEKLQASFNTFQNHKKEL